MSIFFIDFLAVHTPLLLVLQWLDPIRQKKLSTAVMMSSYELFSLPRYMYISYQYNHKTKNLT